MKPAFSKTRVLAFLRVGAIYLVAFLAAFGTYHGVDVESFLLRIFLADLAATLFVFTMSTLHHNTSIYDPYWSVAPMVLVLVYVDSWNPASALMVFIIFAWGIRLTINWARGWSGLADEDWRYAMFRRRYPRVFVFINLFGLHVMPTLVVFLVMLPAYAFLQAEPGLSLLVVLGAALSLGATGIQLLSDEQLRRFHRRQPGVICREGLWRFSRHPNYFGEILMWFGVYVMMLGVAGDAYLLVIGPIVNLLMFLSISLPLMERRLSSYEGYAQYEEEISLLIPLPEGRKITQLFTRRSG